MRGTYLSVLIIMASAAQAAEQRNFLNEIICQSKGNLFFVAGQKPNENYVDAVLYLRLASINNVVVAESYGGHIALNTWLEGGKVPSTPDTYGIFAGENMASNPRHHSF